MSFLFNRNHHQQQAEGLTGVTPSDTYEPDLSNRVRSPSDFRISPSLSVMSESSSRSYRISTERTGEKDMTEEEVNELVQKALRNARRATSLNKSAVRSPNPYPSGGSWSSMESSTPSIKSPVQSRIIDTKPSETDSQKYMHALLLPNDSHNSGDSMIRRVEAEIEQARIAAEVAGRRLAGALSTRSSSWTTSDLVSSPTQELAAILDEHLEEDDNLRDILDVSNATNSADNSFEKARDAISSDFKPEVPKEGKNEKRVALSYIPPHADEYTEQEAIPQTKPHSSINSTTVNEEVAPALSEDYQDAVEMSFSQHEAGIAARKILLEVDTIVENDSGLEVSEKPFDEVESEQYKEENTEEHQEKGQSNEEEVVQEAAIEHSFTEDSEYTEVTVEDDDDDQQTKPGIGFVVTSEDTADDEHDDDDDDATSEYTEETVSEDVNSEYTEETFEEIIEEEEVDDEMKDKYVVKHGAANEVVAKDAEEIVAEGHTEEEVVEEEVEEEYTEEEIVEEEYIEEIVEEEEEIPIGENADEVKVIEEKTNVDDTNVTEQEETLVQNSRELHLVNVSVQATHISKEKEKPKSKPTLWWTRATEDESPQEPETPVASKQKDSTANADDKIETLLATNKAETAPVEVSTVLEVPTDTEPADIPIEATPEKQANGSSPALQNSRTQPPPLLLPQEAPVKASTPTKSNTMAESVVTEVATTPHKLPAIDTSTNRAQFRYPYPPMPSLIKPRATNMIIKDHASEVAEPFTNWSEPKQELAQLLLAANDESLARRSNACGALKILSLKKRNQWTLVRNKGFFAALAYAITQPIPRTDREVALDARDRAVSTLLNISAPKDNRTLIMGHPDLVRAIVKVIREDLGETRVNACGTIAMLAKTPKNRESLSQVGGLLDCLAFVLMDEIARKIILSDEEKKEESDNDGILGSDTFSTSDGGSTTLDDMTDIRSVGASSSVSSAQAPRAPARGVCIRRARDEKQDEFVARARMNACAALSHLAKECSVSQRLASNKNVLTSLVKVSREFENPIHTKCLEVLSNLTRLAANNSALSRDGPLVETLLKCGKSKLLEDRIWALRTFQNITAEASSKIILANSRVLTLLSICAMRKQMEEQTAAVASLYNLSTEPGAVVPLTNTRNVVATLVHLAHDSGTTKQIRSMACDALATIGLWLQTLAGSGKVPEGVAKVLLPTHKTFGWDRWA